MIRKPTNLLKNPVRLAVVLAVIILLVSGGIMVARRNDPANDFNVDSVLPPPITQPPSTLKVIDKAELTANDGKDGRHCYVAVEQIVYEIQQGRLWNNGQHDTSNGQAYCGADLTEAIKQSPHGTSKLSELTKIGQYKP